jgi:hypothetical protein
MDQPATPSSTPPPAPPADDQIPSAHNPSLWGGFLSYLIPGLGQIAQGRVAKGVLFFFCVYILFFYGMYLGAAEVKIAERVDKDGKVGVERPYKITSNVYLPRGDAKPTDGAFNTLLNNLYNRPQFLGQFWIGMAAWPAIAQYMAFDRAKEDNVLSSIDRAWEEVVGLGEGNPELQEKMKKLEALEKERRHPLFGELMREPSPREINAVHNGTDKRLELAWVFTVIAGVLNIMVIYDAFAGAAHPPHGDEQKKET